MKLGRFAGSNNITCIKLKTTYKKKYYITEYLMNRVFSTMLRRRIESPAHQKIDISNEIYLTRTIKRHHLSNFVAYALRLWGRITRGLE